MSDLFEEVENIVWTMPYETVLEQLERLHPGVEIKIYPCGPLVLPSNVITCCGTGAGEVTPVKRLSLVFARSKDDSLESLALEEIWTSPNAVPWNNNTWEMIYWDTEKDTEVFLDEIN